MPYDIRKTTDGYHVYNQETGEDKGKSVSRAKAEAHMRALYANEHPTKTTPGMLDGGKIAGVPTYLDDTYTRRQVESAWVDGKSVAISPPVSIVSTSSTPASVTTPATVPAYRFGGIMKKLKKKASDVKEAVGGELDRMDDSIFGGEGLGSNIRKLKKDLRSGGRGSRGTQGYKKGGVLSRLSKTIDKGGLHESLGIPAGKNIPEKRIVAAAKKKGKVGKQARLAETFAKFRK